MGEMIRAAAKKPEAKRENRPSQTQKTGPSQSISSPVEQILFLQRTIGNQAVGKMIKSGALQAKLRIGQPGDIYEQEADRMANAVMRMPEPGVQWQPEEELVQTKPVITPLVQRQSEGEEEEEEFLQQKEVPGQSPEVTPDLSSSIQSLKGGGQPLPESLRAYFEPRFGQDFSQVRVHADAKASETARAVNARAFTLGQ